jgi:hypothetical protein
VEIGAYSFSPGSTDDWFDYISDWEKEIDRKKTKYLCIYYEDLKKVILLICKIHKIDDFKCPSGELKTQ